MILIDWTNMAQSVLHENWKNWLQQHGYTLVFSEYVEDIEIQMFASNQTICFAVYAPISFGLIYINIPTAQDALMLIARLRQLLLLPWDTVQDDGSSPDKESRSETFLTIGGGTMQEKIDTPKAQISPQEMQQEEVIDQPTVLQLQKDTAILIASLKQMAERNICPKIAWRAIKLLTQYQKILDRLLAQL
ncbi:hypothetical protein SAMD00079811_57820 [Scytonema sp. HK-05]|nr:hypothetical protein SAMD00079811_57820 [Scytonema sp. HK-05]